MHSGDISEGVGQPLSFPTDHYVAGLDYLKDVQPALGCKRREGFVPAGPEKRVDKRHMGIPKTGHVNDHIHMITDFSEVLCPAERRALREIVETAEVVRENGHTYLVARVSSETLDSLATFETSRADLHKIVVHEVERHGVSVFSQALRR